MLEDYAQPVGCITEDLQDTLLQERKPGSSAFLTGRSHRADTRISPQDIPVLTTGLAAIQQIHRSTLLVIPVIIPETLAECPIDGRVEVRHRLLKAVRLVVCGTVVLRCSKGLLGRIVADASAVKTQVGTGDDGVGRDITRLWIPDRM